MRSPLEKLQAQRVAIVRKLALAGLRIFPLKPNSKIPAFKGWQEAATSDPDKAGAWWVYDPNYNVGIHAVDHLVVDQDLKDDGPATWNEIVGQREMFGDEPAPTLTVWSGSGGIHEYYSLPPGKQVGNSTSTKFGRGIDIKSEGGLVVGPGSVIDGRTYDIIPTKKVKRGDIQKIMYPPEWMIQRAEAPRDRSKLAGVRVTQETPEAVAEAKRWLSENAPEAVEGQGGDLATFKIAAKMFDLGLEFDTAMELVWDWNIEKAHPQWEYEALETKLQSGMINRQRAIGVDNPGAPPAGFEAVELPTDAEINASALKEGVPAAIQLEALTPPDRKQFRLTTFKDACAMALTVTNDPLVLDVLYAGETSVTFGESGAGKSFVMLDLAFHVAAGLPWQGKPVKQGAVIWLAAEGGFGVYKRILALKEHYGVEDVPLYVLQRPVDLLHEDRKEVAGFIKLIQETQKEIGADVVLVLIDTLNRVMAGGNENGPEDMGHLLDNFDRIKFAVGPKLHLNIVHHTGLTLGRARGHTSLKAAADTEIEVSKPGRFVVKKARDEEGGFKFDYSLRKLELGSDVKGNPVTSAVVVSRVVEANDEIAGATDSGRVLRALDGKLAERSRQNDIPETAPFNKLFLLTAFVEAGLTRRNGEPRTLEGYHDRKSGDRTEFYNLLGEYTKSGVIMVDKKDQYSRVVKP